ncbi:MAG: FAD-dependent oxidoreductase [Epsilonproteobacteria bacterium]|nr:FAD-dependent oxidoreductase [Campylobacterota bacterium]
MYDVAIIGAGINGCAISHAVIEAKKSVILFDMSGIASGGSGAAGAFISPKFSKEGELRELLNDAFLFSMDFYEKNFPQHLTKAQLLHIAKDEAEAQTLRAYKQNSPLRLKTPSKTLLSSLTSHAKECENVSLDAGVVDAPAMCQALSNGCEFKREKVTSLVYNDGMWIINECYAAKSVVLATGAYESLIYEPYSGIRGVWGHRIDVRSACENSASIHQFVSISPSKEGEIAIGATHNVHYHPQKNKEPYDIEAGRIELLEKASRTMDLGSVEILRDFTGLRSGSVDYMPLIGKVVLANETQAAFGNKLRVKHFDYEQFLYYPELYMINGNGGYGFVLAPYLAKMLSELMLQGKPISERLVPARFFARWARR